MLKNKRLTKVEIYKRLDIVDKIEVKSLKDFEVVNGL